MDLVPSFIPPQSNLRTRGVTPITPRPSTLPDLGKLIEKRGQETLRDGVGDVISVGDLSICGDERLRTRDLFASSFDPMP
jgi:hypothetical protein